MSDKPKWTLVPNAPMGTERFYGFVDNYDEASGECVGVGGVGLVHLQTFYPEDRDRGRSLRDAREAAGITPGMPPRLRVFGHPKYSGSNVGRCA